MPLTYAHPALILPFVGRVPARGWLSGLVAGSMAPDFARLIPGVGREFSHSVQGMVLVDFPLAIVLAILASMYLIPRAARLPGLHTLARAPQQPFGWHWLALAALIGCTTHLGWDLFTHGNHRIFHAEILDTKLADTVAGPFFVRQLAWGINTLVGLLALAIASFLYLRRTRTPLRSFLAPAWLRLAAIGILPLLVLPMEHPIRVESLLSDLATILHSDRPNVRLAILASGLGFAGLFLFETRRRKSSTPTA